MCQFCWRNLGSCDEHVLFYLHNLELTLPGGTEPPSSLGQKIEPLAGWLYKASLSANKHINR